MSSLATTMTMTNAADLASRLLKVGLQAIARSLDDFLARATKSRLSPVQILEEIVRLEEIDKSRRSQESRLRRARIGRFKPIADFDWNWPRRSSVTSSSARSPSNSSARAAISLSSAATAWARP